MKIKLLIISLIFLMSCEKDILPTPDNTEPVFYARFESNEVLYNWQAGMEDYYMYSDSEIDSMNVNQFIGTLKPQSGDNKNALQFKFRNSEIGASISDTLLHTGERRLTDSICGFPQNTRIKVKFIPLVTTDVNRHRWTINGNISSNLDEPVYTFDSTEINNFPVYLHTYFNNGCIATSKRCLDFRNMECAGEFDFQQISGMNYQFDIPSDMINDVEKVIWYIEDNVIESKSLNYTFQNTGNQFVNADIFFNNGCVACVGKKLQVDPSGTSLTCNNNFKMEYIPVDPNEHMQLGSVEINYWDNDGILYSSKFSEHDQIINILEAGDYKENHEGKETAKLKLKGDFTLHSEQGGSVVIDNFEGLIAIAVE